MWKHMKTDCTDPASLKLSTRRPNPHAVLPVRWLLVAASKMSSAYFMFHKHYSLRANGRLLIVMEDLPVILNVKDGFHHDLNANVNVELRAPTLPCIIWDCEFYYQHFLILKKVVNGLPSARSSYWPAKTQPSAEKNLTDCLMCWNHQPFNTRQRLKLCYHIENISYNVFFSEMFTTLFVAQNLS